MRVSITLNPESKTVHPNSPIDTNADQQENQAAFAIEHLQPQIGAKDGLLPAVQKVREAAESVGDD